jgi:uncharacterized protein (TIRG00374 family)
MKQKIVRYSVLVGVVIFCFIIYKIGPLQIWENICKITWQNFLVLMALRVAYWLVRTLSWKLVVDAYEGKASLLDLCMARLSGHAVSQLTPSAVVGGEVARVFMIDCSSKKLNLATVIVDKTIELLTVIFFTIFGVVMAIARISMPVKLKTIFIVSSAVLFLLLLFVMSKQRKGLFEWLVKSLAKMKIRPGVLQKNMEKIKETDEYISDFYRSHRTRFIGSFLIYSLLILIWSLEIHITLLFIGATNISFADSFLVTVLGNLAFTFSFIPGSLGIYEATYVGLFAMLGKGTDLGITLVLIRRILALLWAGIGLLTMLKPARQKSKPPG